MTAPKPDKTEIILKPCPFCGSKATMEPWHGGGPLKQIVSCDNEYCQVSPGVGGETPVLAAELWNRRA